MGLPTTDLRAELDFLLATADRSDPLEETVLCLVEAAAVAMAAARQRRVLPDPAATTALLRQALGAARAAVTAATFALVEHQDTP